MTRLLAFYYFYIFLSTHFFLYSWIMLLPYYSHNTPLMVVAWTMSIFSIALVLLLIAHLSQQNIKKGSRIDRRLYIQANEIYVLFMITIFMPWFYSTIIVVAAVLHDYDVYTHIDTHLNIKKVPFFFRLKTQFHFVPTCNKGNKKKKFHNNRKKAVILCLLDIYYVLTIKECSLLWKFVDGCEK